MSEPHSIAQDKTRPTVLFGGGGTSGHINPALAIARELQRVRPEVDCVFTGTARGLENDIIPRQGFEFIPVSASPFRRKLSPALLKAVRDLFRGRRECRDLIRSRRPAAAVGTGGYAAGPLLAAARQMDVPYLIHEQNAFPGRSNRVMASAASSVCVSYAAAQPYFKGASRVVLTGNPIDSLYFQLRQDEARHKLGIPSGQKLILVSGGSLGARTLNQTVTSWLKDDIRSRAGQSGDEGWKVILVTGKKLFAETQEMAAGIPAGRLELHEYLYDMPWYMAAADVYISRAGAGTCAEIAALGKPAIMVPYPAATGDHQTHNAQAFQAVGGAFLCPNDQFSAAYLDARLRELEDQGLRLKMGSASRTLATPDAARDIVRELLRIIDGPVLAGETSS